MNTRSIPERVQLGDVELWFETVPEVGSEETSGRLGAATGQVVDAFDRARSAIVEIGTRVAATVQDLHDRGTHPSELQVEFGLKFGAKGSLIVSEASAEASLTVRITYSPRTPHPTATP